MNVQSVLHIYLQYLRKTRIQSTSKHHISSIAVTEISNYDITLLVTLLTMILIAPLMLVLQTVTEYLKFCTEGYLNGSTNIIWKQKQANDSCYKQLVDSLTIYTGAFTIKTRLCYWTWWVIQLLSLKLKFIESRPL